MKAYAMSDIRGCVQVFDSAPTSIYLSGENQLVLCEGPYPLKE